MALAKDIVLQGHLRAVGQAGQLPRKGLQVRRRRPRQLRDYGLLWHRRPRQHVARLRNINLRTASTQLNNPQCTRPENVSGASAKSLFYVLHYQPQNSCPETGHVEKVVNFQVMQFIFAVENYAKEQRVTPSEQQRLSGHKLTNILTLQGLLFRQNVQWRCAAPGRRGRSCCEPAGS